MKSSLSESGFSTSAETRKFFVWDVSKTAILFTFLDRCDGRGDGMYLHLRLKVEGHFLILL